MKPVLIQLIHIYVQMSLLGATVIDEMELLYQPFQKHHRFLPGRMQIDKRRAPEPTQSHRTTQDTGMLPFSKHVSIAASRTLYAINDYFVQLVRNVVTHAVNQH